MTDTDWQWGVSNAGSGELLVWIEPWADEFAIPVRSTITLSFSNTFDEACEIESTSDHLVVWVGAGQTVRVFIDGALQESASAEMPVPGGFAGSTKEFLNLAFGGQPSARLAGRSSDAAGQRSWWKRARARLGL